MTGFRKRPIDANRLKEFLDESPVQTIETEDGDEEIRLKHADDEKITAGFTVRITEKELEQLRYISKYAGVSMNTFIRMAIKSHLPRGLALAKKRKKDKLF